MFYRISERLEEITLKECGKKDYKYVAIVTEEEFQKNSAVFDMGIDLEMDVTASKIGATKAEVNYDSVTGMVIGAKVTLRGERMYEFLDRLFNLALPRVRDFRGINPNSFDGRGNYSLGVKEQLIFPEIEYDKIDKVRGMDICIVTTANTDEEARELLALMGAPFAK